MLRLKKQNLSEKAKSLVKKQNLSEVLTVKVCVEVLTEKSRVEVLRTFSEVTSTNRE